MSYSYYNNNALGKFENDCTVRAISTAIGKSWDNVYDMLSIEAQKQGTMQDDRDFIIDFLDYNFELAPTFGLTVGEVAKMYDKDIVLITMEGHITCAKYGRIYDTFDPRQRLAEYVWLVK